MLLTSVSHSLIFVLSPVDREARQLKPVDICCLPLLFDCVTVPRRNFCREPRCGDHQPGTRELV